MRLVREVAEIVFIGKPSGIRAFTNGVEAKALILWLMGTSQVSTHLAIMRFKMPVF